MIRVAPGLLGAGVLLFLSACGEREAAASAPALDTDTGAEGAAEAPAPKTEVTGTLVPLGPFAREGLLPRDVTVWLPPGYDENAETSYAVLYMHDGQNLFEASRAYAGAEWGVDETLTRLMDEGAVRPTIVVALENTAARWWDYAPKAMVARLPEDFQSGMRDWQDNPATVETAIYSDTYLALLVEDVKPAIDAQFRTRPGPEDTFLMGSSMGGLISLYGAAEYPEVFGGAGCLSIHWPLADPEKLGPAAATGAAIGYLEQSRIDPSSQRLWFDRGTETLDAYYAPYAQAMEMWFASAHPGVDDNVTFAVYEGTEHNERAWAARLEDPMVFLLGQGTDE